jgi:adenylate cyclase
MNSSVKALLALRQMDYLMLDAQLQIVEQSEDANLFADPTYSIQPGQDCRLAFPELIGTEAILEAILQGQMPQFELKAISRSQPNATLLYFDLCVAPVLELAAESATGGTAAGLLVLLADVTERMNLEQSLVQASNELGLLLSALTVSKTYVEKLVTSIADALLVTTATGEIKTVNPATQTLFGYSEAELVGASFALILPDAPFLIQAIQPNELEEGLLSEIEVICQTKSGEKRLIAFSCSKVAVEGTADFIYIGRDVTEQKLARQRLMVQYTVARILSESDNFFDAIDRILPTLCHHLEWDAIELWMPQQRFSENQLGENQLGENQLGENQYSDRLTQLCQPCPSEDQACATLISDSALPDFVPPEEVALQCIKFWSRSPLSTTLYKAAAQSTLFTVGQGLPGRVWQMRSPQWIANVQTDPGFVRSTAASQAKFRTAVGLPMQNSREILGVLVVLSRATKAYNPELRHTIAVISSQLGQFIQRKQAETALNRQQAKTKALLLNILPEQIADRLQSNPGTIAEHFAEATVLFADLVGFTEIASAFSPLQLVNLLNQIFSAFDRLSQRYGLEKIKTIGDAYMVVGGVPNPRSDHAEAIAEMALEMQAEIDRFNQQHHQALKMRIGIHSGSLVAGVIGIQKFSYDLWGDTVNTASRMESHGQAGKIQVSAATFDRLWKDYYFESRGPLLIKGKGHMMTYFLLGKR